MTMVESTSTIRWICKKIARKSLSLASFATGRLEYRNQNTTCVRVLTYHRFGSEVRNPYCITAEDFSQQMAYLAAENLAITLDDFESFVRGRRQFSRPRVLVTIDDGFSSTYSIALPILESFAIPSVAYVSPRLIENGNISPYSPESYMTWDEVSATSDTLMKIGSHSLSHTSYGVLSRDEVFEDASESRKLLESRLPYPVLSFAYPYGTRADYNGEIAEIVSSCGYETAFTSRHGPIYPLANMYSLPRVKVESGENLAYFKRLIAGGMDNWQYVDSLLWRLQARR